MEERGRERAERGGREGGEERSRRARSEGRIGTREQQSYTGVSLVQNITKPFPSKTKCQDPIQK